MVDERPATYRSLAASREFRAIFGADVLSLLGDQAAIVALSILVYQRSEPPLLAAAVYSLAFLPWGVGGPVLAALADRWPRRRVMIVCALSQAGLIGLAALPGIPLPVLVTLVSVAAFVAPPFEAARGALLPEILDDDRYVLASSLGIVTHQAAQLVGFVVGGVLAAALSPQLALGINAATFVATALLVAAAVRPRALEPTGAEPTTLWQDTVQGVRWVAQNRAVRRLLALVWVSSFYLMVPEALAAAYANALGRGPEAVGVVMAAAAGGMIIGSTALTRFVRPEGRRGLMYPLTLLGALPLVVVAWHPGFVLSIVCFAATGFCCASMIPAKAAVMTATEPAVRGRVFGVASTGLCFAQVVGIVGAGALAQVLPVQTVIAGGGVVALALGAALASGARRARRDEQRADVATHPALQPAS